MELTKLVNWTARRAGGRITIIGQDVKTGTQLKIVGVDKIESGDLGNSPIATDKDGIRYELI